MDEAYSSTRLHWKSMAFEDKHRVGQMILKTHVGIIPWVNQYQVLKERETM